MPNMRSRGNGLFIELSRTPAERKQAEKFLKLEEENEKVRKENEEMKKRLEKIEAMLMKQG